MHVRRQLALAGLLATVVGCGGGSSSSSSPSRPPTASPRPTPTPTAPITPAPTPTPTPLPPPPPTPAPTAPPTPSCAAPPQSPPTTTIAANYPTALAFAPDGRLFYAERSGTVRVWQNGASHVFATVPTVTREADGSYSERGLLGLAISATFNQDRLVFAFYSDTDYAHQHVIRWHDCAGTAGNAAVIITLPSGGDCCHKGGRLAIGTDGKLYVTLGDEHDAPAAQNGADVRGKVLRYNLDGSIPADNPLGPGNPVYAYGLRNPFGIAVSSSGQIAVTNNGPSGDAGSPGTGYDTLIVNLARGGAYEWPLCYGYSHPLAGSCSGHIAPDWSSEASTVVPTGAAFVDAAGPAGYAGHLVFCTFNSGMLIVTPSSPHALVSGGPSGCHLDVKQGPDHALYYSDAQHIYRLG